jgi:isobutyryl-CoA mutase
MANNTATHIEAQPFTLTNNVRFVTAASLFDGHDAAIHIMRRILQAQGAEVIHLGHNRSVQEVVDAAVQEDAQGIAISSYQGGHMEYFSYILELLKEKNASHIKVYGGGGGVIVPEEIVELHRRGVSRIFSPEDGFKMGLVGMIQHMLRECDFIPPSTESDLEQLSSHNVNAIARVLSTVERLHQDENVDAPFLKQLKQQALSSQPCPVIGFTGTGGAGKSSLIDEVILRYLQCFPKKKIAILSVDPSRRRTGGALLGDRIRMNAANNKNVFVRSMATRRAHLATSVAVKDALSTLRMSGFDLVILETAGIGQSDSEVTELADLSVYVMTPEYGAPSQLEKIDMLDFADLIVINKFDKRGAQDALREVSKTYQRNHERFQEDFTQMPVFGTSAHRFYDLGTNTFFNALIKKLGEVTDSTDLWAFEGLPEGAANTASIIPANRTNYLGQIAQTVRSYHQATEKQAQIAARADGLWRTLKELGDEEELALAQPYSDAQLQANKDSAINALRKKYNEVLEELMPETRKALQDFKAIAQAYRDETQSYEVRGKSFAVENFSQSLSGNAIPKVCVPQTSDWQTQVQYLRSENKPGDFPYTGGVFPFKRKGEDPTRMFAGEGTPERTNRRFHFVSKGQPAVRLSTAFDSVTLYGADPDLRPDIWGKIGNSGVSVCSLDDAKRLYSGFDLCAPSSSVSMTINGPAPTILAFFFNAAIDAEVERRLKDKNQWADTKAKIDTYFKDRGQQQPTYRGDLPEGHNGNGLGFLGVSADKIVDPDFYLETKTNVIQTLRGTVQADILKEDQAQNTCIFSTEFSLRMMGDVQAYFSEHDVRNFYSVSISGYHIAEAGANPISQLAFTLSNGFTFVEYYRARGLDINAFAPNLSFFFSNGLDPEYAVIGRVARRIWAITMRDLYEANGRSQKLKYHIQTSGRSLHAQEIDFNDIRTTLQALYAIIDNCNSLHTNAYDEAITTPTEASVRRAIAIQLIINRELGLTRNENPMQGSHFIEELTDLVEEAVLVEFEALDRRGGVLGAMETMYQRSKIQEESMYYEGQKTSGELPIVGVNTFLNPQGEGQMGDTELIRSTEEEKQAQLNGLQGTHALNETQSQLALKQLKSKAQKANNLFAELLETSKTCTLGQISDALYQVGGAYRRSM